MNDLQESSSKPFEHNFPRHAGATLELAATVSPVVVLMGARQTGKSTLARMGDLLGETPDRLYVTLDDLVVRERAEKTPDELLASAPRMTIDEVQRSPDLILAVKRAVDEDRRRRPGRFFLTGSANLLLMKRISETLAGRATYVTLWPFTVGEKRGEGRTGRWEEILATPVEKWRELFSDDGDRLPVDWDAEARRGGYPVPSLHLETPSQRAIWFEGYLRTYLERDLQDLASIDNLVDFRRLMRAACLRLGNLLNQAELGRDVRLPRPTVHRYLNLLETSYQLVRLEPYSVNRTKRLIKTPKLYWSDAGLAMHLAGLDEPSGALLENQVLMDILAWRDARIPRPEVLYWRTSGGLEVDFVIEDRGRLLPIEIKSGTRPRWSDCKGLRAFFDEYPDRCAGGLLLHGGDELQWMAEGLLAAPLRFFV